MRDKSSDERATFNQQIHERERQMDELAKYKHNMENILANLETENYKWFSRMQEINESDSAEVSIQRNQDEVNGKYQYIRKLLGDSDELNRECSQATNELEETRLQLQKERDELPWE
ncbi:hypothetical protein A5804_000075 [Enterococcus faecium]|uniref:Uncharacterized protein n=1 Tax=Enterococcus faecium TaxID=1352 RepID=A0AB73NDK8_ENTFC|nr:hypothetical protein [Enterococcus faecium]OTN98592.1 hypothetical protein A5804_000075 [Enterococcus faecium]